MAALAKVNNNQGHGRHDQWGRGPLRGNDDEDGLVEEWEVGTLGERDWKMMRKRPRSPPTTTTASPTGAQHRVAHRNKSELTSTTVISSERRRSSDTTINRTTSSSGHHPHRIQGTAISHLSSGPARTRTTTTTIGREQQQQQNTSAMCQNFIGRRDSESTTGRGLQAPLRPHSPNHCNTWDRRLRSPDRGRDTAMPSRHQPSERTQRDRDTNASFERRFLDNDRSRTGTGTSTSHQQRHEETNGASRGHPFRSGKTWNDNRFNRPRDDSRPRFQPRQGNGGPNYRNGPETHNAQPNRPENARAREEVSRPNVDAWRHPSDSPQPGHFHSTDDRYARRRDSLERSSDPSRDFHNSSNSHHLPTSRRDLEQGRFPERRSLDSLDQRRVPPARDHDSWQHAERRTNHGTSDASSSQYPNTRFHHDTNSNRHHSTSDIVSCHPPGRDIRTCAATNPDHEPWRSTESTSPRDFSYSNPSSQSGPDRMPYEENQGYRSARVPDPGRFSETRNSTYTSSSCSPARDQWHRQERHTYHTQRDRDSRQHVQPTDLQVKSSRAPGQDQGHRQESQFCQPQRDRDYRQQFESTDKPSVPVNSLRSQGRDQWYQQERQTAQSTTYVDSKQNSETLTYTTAKPVPRSNPDNLYRHEKNGACEMLHPRSNPSTTGTDLMSRVPDKISPAPPTTSYASTSTSTSPRTLNSPRGNPAAHHNSLDSQPRLQERNPTHTMKSQHYDGTSASRKREATDTQDLNAPNKRLCNVTRDLVKSETHTPPSVTSIPRQSNEASTADSPMKGAPVQEKSNPIAPTSNQGTSALSQPTNSMVLGKKPSTSTKDSQSIKKTIIGIPMRWLKPPKPKLVPKEKPKEKSSLAKKVNESEKAEPAPSSPLINRTVTDSEGGSTVSNTRELLAMMEKKTKQPQVPTAIVTMQTVEVTSLDSPPRTPGENKVSTKQRNVKPGKKLSVSLDKEDTDDEPPLESDDDSSIESSSDESDTDDEEVMLWASKMFGVPLPSNQAQTSQADDMTREGKPTVSKKPLKLRLKLSSSKILPGTPSSASFNRPDNFVEDERMNCTKIKAVQLELPSEENDGHLMEVPMRLAVRGRRKKNKPYLKKLPDISPEEQQVDLEQERMEREEEKRIREEAKPLTAAQIREILGEDVFDGGPSSNWVRRSVRQPSRALLNSKPLKALVEGLKNNHPDMVVLKMKKYINDPNAPSVVLDAALEALEENTNCEALYIQNFNEGMRDKQVLHLLRILQSSTCRIWCLNIGENYNVDTETWDKFTKGLRRTKITHMYASEHTITTEMKDEIRETIRENRSKHDMHINPNNLDVIIQCTHCWWNPINAKALRPYLKKKGYEHILNDKEAQGLRGSTSEAPSA